jgi:hypothetical protein
MEEFDERKIGIDINGGFMNAGSINDLLCQYIPMFVPPQ